MADRPKIKYVFETDAAHTTTREFYRQIRENADEYKDLVVVNLTRVKNLKSTYAHEYLQFIVLHQPSNERARVYVERRGFQTQLPYPDWVSYGTPFNRNGPDPWGFLKDAGEPPAAEGTITDLPMPLAGLTFKEPGVPLVQLAEIFDVITRVGGVYDLEGHSCFWFANTAFTMIQTELGDAITKKEQYTRYNMAGKGGGGRTDLFALVIPRSLRFFWKGEARKFEKMKGEGYERGNNGEADEDALVEIQDQVNEIIEPFTLDEYFEILRQEGVQMDLQTLDEEARNAPDIPAETDVDAGQEPRMENLNDYVQNVVKAGPKLPAHN